MVLENNVSMAQFSDQQYLDLIVSAVKIHSPNAKPDEIKDGIIMYNKDFRVGLKSNLVTSILVTFCINCIVL